MVLPGLDRQTFTARREVAGTDDEGNPWGTWNDLGTFTGAWGTPSSNDLAVAGRRGERIDAVVATATYIDAQPGDQVVGLQGRDWTVVSIEPLPVVAHIRVMLREIS
jgi:hypothetical protein